MENKLDKIVSLAKRRGFVYQGSEIYGGLAGTWDYGPLGVVLKNNIKQLWWNRFVDSRQDMYPMDAAILMNQKVWQSSGHVAGFADPLVTDIKTKKRYRADHLLEDCGIDVSGLSLDQMAQMIKDKEIKSVDGNDLTQPQQFNMMFKTNVGAVENEESVSYLRPETAQGMFVNFKNIIDTFHPKLPFGMAQIGKAFRNEIAPRDFIFRVREFEQMEIEYFIKPDQWQEHFEHFRLEMVGFIKDLGLSDAEVYELEVAEGDRAHYSERTIDFEYQYSFGRKELYGLAYRTDYDLIAHTNGSGIDLNYYDEETKTKFVPHVIEPSFGVDRTILALLNSAYTEDDSLGDERVFLKFRPKIAPIKLAIFPLLKNKPDLVNKAKEVFNDLRLEFKCDFDDNGNIGKRYRRQDEIGTPWCVTVDFETLDDNTVTLRDRDSGNQTRIEISQLKDYVKSNLV